jgi:hypothetical protein
VLGIPPEAGTNLIIKGNKPCLKNEVASAPPFSLQTQTKYTLATSVFAIVWIVAVATGLRAFLIYDSNPGSIGAVPKTWPGSRIERSSNGATLVMLAHPHCPCTRASIGELAHIMARLQGKLIAYVLFVTPSQSGPDWEDTDLRRSAARIPGVKVITDMDGIEARRFGAETSGHTLLFGADGRLLFNGGITKSRGHAGGNAGESAIVSLVNNQTPERTETFIFGCPLHAHEQTPGSLCLK